jgi:hypothetical protein
MSESSRIKPHKFFYTTLAYGEGRKGRLRVRDGRGRKKIRKETNRRN